MRDTLPRPGQIWIGITRNGPRYVKVDRGPAGGFIWLCTVEQVDGKWLRKRGTRLNCANLVYFQRAYSLHEEPPE